MIEQENRVHGNTKKAADLSLAKREISQDSHRAIYEGRITLEEAREFGREGSSYGPAPRTVSKDDRTPTATPCLCGCGLMVPRRFAPGHDARMFRVAREHLTEGREFTSEQREYLEASGKMEQARKRAEREAARASKRRER